MRRSALGLFLLAASCSLPDHENPFDPETPPALQARATLAGSVALEPRGATPASLAGVDVSVPAVGSVTTDAAGAWSLPGVPPGTYSVLFRRVGWDDVTVGGVVVTLDDGDRTVTVPPVSLALSRGHVTGTVTLSAGAVAGFPVGSDLSGTVVTLEAAGEPTRTAVTDATGQYRFEGVPASLPGASYVLGARRPFFLPASGTIAAVADETTTAPGLTLDVAAAALTGHAVATNVVGGGDLVVSGGIAVAVSGTAFSGAPWSTAAVTGPTGAWTTGALPPGTYDLVATADGRTCEPYARRAVESGAAADAGTVLCLDAVAPGALALGAPAVPSGAQPGYTRFTTVTVPVSAQATDATLPSNLAGYETTVGAGADFSAAVLAAGTPPSLDFTGLATDARNVLWARPVDTAGNAGVPVAVEVVHDGVPPPTPALSTPRAIVSATTTSVTLTGSESDATFHHYEICTETVGALGACPTTPSCTFAPSPASAAVSLAANLRTCVHARGVDAAGNVSGGASLAVVSDLTPPPVPSLAPLFDPTKLTVRADYVDFFVSSPSADAPAGLSGWDKIAWLEADSGAGFEPICPQLECHAGDVWQPCSCGCTDERLLCQGTSFTGIRMPLLGGLANQLNVRALDVAGNYGPGIGQKVITAGLEGFIAASGAKSEAVPRLRGRLLTYLDGFDFTLVDLGANARHDVADERCTLGTRGAYAPNPSAEAASPTLVVHVSGGASQLAIRRAGLDGAFCTGDDTSAVVYTFGAPNSYISTVAASGERVAWLDQVMVPASATLRLREPGPDGLLGNGDDTSAVVTTTGADPFIFEVLLARGVLAYRTGDTAYVVLADPATGSFAGKLPQVLASGVSAVALSADGTRLALATTSGALTVRTPGADGVHLTGDDVIATRAAAGGTIQQGALSVEGAHLVALEWGGGQIVHWYAGGNAAFESSGGDDTVSRQLPSADNRYFPSLGSGLSAGYLVYQVNALGFLLEQPDVLSLDLTGLRWEVVGVGASPTVRTNGSGVLFYGSFAEVRARTSDGRTSAARSMPAAFDVYGDDLVEALGTGLAVSGPGPNGLWFDADDVERTPLHAGTFSNVVVKEGKAAAFRLEGAAYVPYVYEPGAGPPAAGTGPVHTATPVLVDAGGTPSDTPQFFQNLAVTGRHVFWSCGADRFSPNLCYRWAGPDGTFGTADDGSPVTPLMRPSNPLAPFPGILGLRASGDRVVILDNGVGAILLLPGADGRFGTADDGETVLGNGVFDRTLVDLSGDWLVTSAAGDFPGEQITLWDLARGGSRQLTSTYSSKDFLALEPSGRLFWHDAIFSEGAVFVFAP